MTSNTDSSLSNEIDGQPTPQISGENDKPSSETVNVPRSEWEQVQRALQKLERGTQSEKDRAVKKTNERMDELQKQVDRVLNAMEQYNISRDDALRVVESQDAEAEEKRMLRELYQTVKGGTYPTAQAQGSAQASGVNVTEVVKEYGLDENSEEVIDIYRRYTSPDEQEKAVLRLAANKNKNKPSVSAAPTITGETVKSEDLESLAAEHSRLMKNPTANMKRLVEIREALNRA